MISSDTELSNSSRYLRHLSHLTHSRHQSHLRHPSHFNCIIHLHFSLISVFSFVWHQSATPAFIISKESQLTQATGHLLYFISHLNHLPRYLRSLCHLICCYASDKLRLSDWQQKAYCCTKKTPYLLNLTIYEALGVNLRKGSLSVWKDNLLLGLLFKKLLWHLRILLPGYWLIVRTIIQPPIVQQMKGKDRPQQSESVPGILGGEEMCLSS